LRGYEHLISLLHHNDIGENALYRCSVDFMQACFSTQYQTKYPITSDYYYTGYDVGLAGQ